MTLAGVEKGYETNCTERTDKRLKMESPKCRGRKVVPAIYTSDRTFDGHVCIVTGVHSPPKSSSIRCRTELFEPGSLATSWPASLLPRSF